MTSYNKKSGFSVVEILIAVGILAMAMIMIAGVFPVGIHFTEVSTDRTIGAVVAQEAFAKIKLYVENMPDINDSKILELSFRHQRDFNDYFDELMFISGEDYIINEDTFSYPSYKHVSPFPGPRNKDYDVDKDYTWTALLRLTDDIDPNLPLPREIQATVFVCRKKAFTQRYYPHQTLGFRGNNYGQPDWTSTGYSQIPVPVKLWANYFSTANKNEIIIEEDYHTVINDGDMIVDDRTGRIYRVLERYKEPFTRVILLDRDFIDEDFNGNSFGPPFYIWAVSPAASIGSTNSIIGKSPCVKVYQETIRF